MVRQAIKRAGAERRFLPPHTPAFDPIETAFSKIRALPKKAAARTLQDLWDAITTEEVGNDFTATRYDPK